MSRQQHERWHSQARSLAPAVSALERLRQDCQEPEASLQGKTLSQKRTNERMNEDGTSFSHEGIKSCWMPLLAHSVATSKTTGLDHPLGRLNCPALSCCGGREDLGSRKKTGGPRRIVSTFLP